MSLQRERTLILAPLLILAAASWAILIWQSRTMNGMGMGLTMGMGAALFLAIWVIIMTTQIARNNAAPIPIVSPMPIPFIVLDCQIRIAHDAAARINSGARMRVRSRCKLIMLSPNPLQERLFVRKATHRVKRLDDSSCH